MKVFLKKEIDEYGVKVNSFTEGRLIRCGRDIRLNCEVKYNVLFLLHDIRLNKGIAENPYGDTKYLTGHVYSVKSTTRSNFKKICKTQNWNFEEFEEVFEHEYLNVGINDSIPSFRKEFNNEKTKV